MKARSVVLPKSSARKPAAWIQAMREWLSLAGPVTVAASDRAGTVGGLLQDPGVDLHAFLDDDPRQVWALDRVTGESVYLEDGDAPALRRRTRSDPSLPLPRLRRRDHDRRRGEAASCVPRPVPPR